MTPQFESETDTAPVEPGGHHAYVFGDFVLDVERGALLRRGSDVPLRRKSFEVLQHLVARHGSLVGKDELMEAVWGTVVVTEGSLTQCLADIRRALGDEQRNVIRTVPRRGYLFDAPVEERTDLPDPAARNLQDAGVNGVAHADGATVGPARAPAHTRPRRRAGWAGAVLLLGVAVLAWWLADRPGSPMQPVVSPAEKSIAVLPFTDMSEGGDHRYFADGMAEELINLLAKSPELLVIARTSSFYFKEHPADVSSIGRQLNVAWLLEGSVRSAGNRVRVTAQLVRTSDGVHVWSQTFERRLGDVLDVQDAIASAVARELRVELAASAPRTPPDPVAYQHFLQAQHLYNRRRDGDMALAEAQFRRATEIDPGFARAWAGLAATYLIWMVMFDLPAESGMPLMRGAVERALAADPEVTEVQVRAYNYYRASGDIDRAEAHWERAVALDPDHPLVLGVQSARATFDGDLERAEALQLRTLQRDPMSWAARSNTVEMLIGLGRLDEARTVLAEGTALHGENITHVKTLEAMLALEDGDYERALAAATASLHGPHRSAMLVMALDGLGHRAEADRALAEVESAPDAEFALRAAEVHARRGEIERAWEWMEVARQRYASGPVNRRSLFVILSTESAPLAPLREDPRWGAMMAEYRRQASDPPEPAKGRRP